MLVVLFLVNSIQVSDAQSWQEYLEQLSEQEEYEDMNWESYEDILEGYAENPINLNTATKEELEQFPFLSAQQIEDIQAYIYQYGEMKSLGELAMIESISWYERSCFVVLSMPGK